MEREPGAVVAGRYRLVEKLGSGGMGTVWLAQDLSLDSTCALKIIDPDKSRSEEVRKRFVREAKAAAQLRGPHVVDVFDRGEHDGVLYIAMEYLEGEDLCTRLGTVGALDPVTTYRIVAHVARALTSAHALGIVHRDLKPENIFLVPSYDEEIAKVLDFGIAQHEAYRVEDQATREGAFLGTPYYVSPEQARGKPTDHRSDLWSLAVITFQCLTGKPPFDSESLGDLMGLILYEPIPKITEVNSALPREMEAFWTRAIERDRELRFQSAREFVEHLGQALGIKNIVTVPTMPPRRQSSIPDDGGVRLTASGLRAARTPRLLEELGGVQTQVESPAVDSTTILGPDPLGVTDQAVTRTRPSVGSLKNGLAQGYGHLKSFPKKPLVIGAIGVGMLIGGLTVLALSSKVPSAAGSNGTLEGASPVLVLPSSVPLSPPEADVNRAADPQVLPVEPAASASAAPRHNTVGPVVGPGNKSGELPARRVPAGVPRRAPAGTPDYGI